MRGCSKGAASDHDVPEGNALDAAAYSSSRFWSSFNMTLIPCAHPAEQRKQKSASLVGRFYNNNNEKRVSLL
jgi:hypothetical protein